MLVDLLPTLTRDALSQSIGRRSTPTATTQFLTRRYKLLEIKFGKNKGWLPSVIEGLLAKRDEDLLAVQREFSKAPSQIPDFLRTDVRHAIAHGAINPRVNPDDISGVRRSSIVLPLLRTIARPFIRDKLGVGEDRWAS